MKPTIEDWTWRIAQLVHVDVERRTIDATEWLASIPAWYGAATAGIVRYWTRMLGISCVEPGTAEEWILEIRRAARLLTPPCTPCAARGRSQRARGIIEWRHPSDRMSGDPFYGLCWVSEIDSTCLCWTDLLHLACLGGHDTTPQLANVSPLGPAAEEIVAHVLHQQATRSSRTWAT